MSSLAIVQQGGAHAAPEDGHADRGVAAGDQQVDGAVVIFPQGQPAPDCGVDAVVQSRGGVEADHGQPIDQEGGKFDPVLQPGGPDQKKCRAHQGQHRACPVGDGGPRPQAVIGVPAGSGSLLMAGGERGGAGDIRYHRGIISRFVHRELLSRKAHLFLRIISITPNRQNINIKITKYSIKNYI